MPTIRVTWDQESQGIGLDFLHEDFKSWEFVAAVLGMAKEKAEQMSKMAMVAQMQAQQQQAAQGAAIRNKIKM